MASPTVHALLSPSSSERWLECTPSAVLESHESFSVSPYAEEGTEAHALAELKLSYALEYIDDEEYKDKFDAFRLSSKYYNEEFNEYVNAYVTEVMTIIKEDYREETLKVFLEARVEFSDIVPSGSGTSDVLIISRNFVHVIDLKFGKGVPVSAIKNSQLRLYACGAIKTFMREGIFSEARMTIIQPRLYDRSTDCISVQDLNDWAINYVKPRAELAIAGQGDLKPGNHCKFCKLREKCSARGQFYLEQAQNEFSSVVVDNHITEPANMTPEMLSRILDIGPLFRAWFEDVEKYAKKVMIQDNVKIGGFKVVAGTSKRIIASPEDVAIKLQEAGYSEEQYLRPKVLQPITTLERNLGKRNFEALCGDYILKTCPSPIIVKETDARPAFEKSQYTLHGEEFED